MALPLIRRSAEPMSTGTPYGLVNPLHLDGMTGAIQERHPRALPARPQPTEPEPTRNRA
jgi:hypothetical protein